MEQSRLALFEERPVPSAVMTLSVPTILSSLVMVLYNLADTLFVGMLNDPVQSAGVALAAPLLLAFNAINNLFGIGSSSMMSRALGLKDQDTVARSSAFGFYCSLICAVLFSVGYTLAAAPLLGVLGADATTFQATADYLFWTVTCGAPPAILNVIMAYLVRAEGSTMHASIGTMSGCLLNIVLDPVFIMPWGFGMGAAGAGFATFLSNCVACLYFFVLLYLRRHTTSVCIDPRKFCFRRPIVVGVLQVGIPASIQNLLNVTGMTLLNNFASAFGADAVAAMGIAQKIYQVPWNISSGFSQGVQPLVGYNYASGNGQRMRRAVLFSIKVSGAFMVLAAIFCHQSAGWLISMFMENESIVAYGTRFLQGFSLGLPFLGMDFLAVGVFQAWARQKCPDLCHHAQDRAGDSGAVHPELPVPAVRSGLRPAGGGSGALHRGGGGAAAAVPFAGPPGSTGGPAGQCLKAGPSDNKKDPCALLCGMRRDLLV